MVEGARLERVYTGNRIEGSNPLSPPFDPLSSPLQACLVLTALTRHQQFPSVGEMASAFVRQKSDAIRAVPDEVGIRPTTTSLLNSPRLKARRKRA